MGGQEGGGQGESAVEIFYRTERDHVGFGEFGAGGESFGALGKYIDVRQCKCAGYFAQESRFLVIRFDECKVDVGRPDFEGESGESGSGAEVEDASERRAASPDLRATPNLLGRGEFVGEVGVPSACSGQALRLLCHLRALREDVAPLSMTERRETREEAARHEEGLAEVAGYNFFRVPDGGQIDAGVPAQ